MNRQPRNDAEAVHAMLDCTDPTMIGPSIVRMIQEARYLAREECAALAAQHAGAESIAKEIRELPRQ